MAAHWLAVFGAETARPPIGLEPEAPRHPARPTSESVQAHENRCAELLKSNYELSRSSSRQLRTPGKGCGFSFESSPFCSYATKDGVHVMMSGEVAEWPGGVDAVSMQHNAFLRNEPPMEADDAHWLLDFYRTFTDPDLEQEETVNGEDIMNQALECLAHIRGEFAFVVYDSIRHRVLAARDREGTAPMFWGATGGGQLLFGSKLADLAECNPTATAFPAGCLFTSTRSMFAYSPGTRGWVIEGEDVPGDIVSFVAAEDAAHFRGVRAIPRITSKGMVCGAVYKVASTADMSRPMAQH